MFIKIKIYIDNFLLIPRNSKVIHLKEIIKSFCAEDGIND